MGTGTAVHNRQTVRCRLDGDAGAAPGGRRLGCVRYLWTFELGLFWVYKWMAHFVWCHD